jgi:hypothetical protein
MISRGAGRYDYEYNYYYAYRPDRSRKDPDARNRRHGALELAQPSEVPIAVAAAQINQPEDSDQHS